MTKGMTPKKAEELRLARGIGKGTKLRIIRVQRGLSQSELAKLSGISIKTLQKFETVPNSVNQTKLNTYYRLCTALDCKISDILEDEDLIEKFNKVK